MNYITVNGGIYKEDELVVEITTMPGNMTMEELKKTKDFFKQYQLDFKIKMRK